MDNINVKEDELVKPQHCVAEVGGTTYEGNYNISVEQFVYLCEVVDLISFTDCDKYHADENIMEKLAAFSEQQFMRSVQSPDYDKLILYIYIYI